VGKEERERKAGERGLRKRKKGRTEGKGEKARKGGGKGETEGRRTDKDLGPFPAEFLDLTLLGSPADEGDNVNVGVFCELQERRAGGREGGREGGQEGDAQ